MPHHDETSITGEQYKMPASFLIHLNEDGSVTLLITEEDQTVVGGVTLREVSDTMTLEYVNQAALDVDYPTTYNYSNGNISAGGAFSMDDVRDQLYSIYRAAATIRDTPVA